jgi:hypothetical protein
MFCAAKSPNANVAAVLYHDAVKTRPWDEIHDPRKQRPAKVHGDPPISKIGKITAETSA